jgi:hypothetical protein
MIYSRCLSLVAFTLLGANAAIAAPQNLTPVVSASIHDEPRDGIGDSFNGSPFTGLLREQSSREDRSIQEFDVSAFGGASLSGATLSGTISVNNAFDNGPRTFDFLLYSGNGVADLSDFEIPATVVGSGSYHPPMDTSFNYSIDVTAAVQVLLNGGATHIGFKVDCSSDPNFPNILSDGASVLSLQVGVTIGTNYCGPAVPNTTGNSGVMSASGSIVATDNNFTVTGSQLPEGEFAYIIASRTQGFVVGPGGSMGDLCLGGNIARFNRAGEVGAVAGGSFSIQLPLGDFPEPPAFGISVLAGDTWNFQCWHRDFIQGQGATSNFTDALEVLFQ